MLQREQFRLWYLRLDFEPVSTGKKLTYIHVFVEFRSAILSNLRAHVPDKP